MRIENHLSRSSRNIVLNLNDSSFIVSNLGRVIHLNSHAFTVFKNKLETFILKCLLNIAKCSIVW